MEKLSIVIPVLNEQETINIFFETLEKISAKIPQYEFEYWFIDDGSTDTTIKILEELHQSFPNVHFIEFSRNFGKESAIYAGLQHSTGKFVILMDVDLQDPPELIPEMLRTIESGDFDSVGTKRISRDKKHRILNFFSSYFYAIINKISNTHIVEGARDYRIMTRQMVDSILSMQEYNRFSKGLFSWVGFKQKYIEYENINRVAGKTSWSVWSLIKYSIEGIVSFSQAPLMLSFFMGFISFFIALIFIIILFVRHFIDPGAAINGWTSMVVILLMVSGVQLLSLGIIGRYISNIYLEVKKRPIYLARKIK
ncbi:glycosyltransferase family 2 protein [Weissella koreensis]|uniref:glycosyltransferase family 2 protein n=1 Tax=Weissella koreensis TaxID=165096 RepID=UPI000CF31354|nr:glycosyltransferase family 2 protein [Weissella koreensis]AVH75299.1 glycosyltransferase [Weissella koreensis]